MKFFPVREIGTGRGLLILYCAGWLLLIPVVWIYWNSMGVGMKAVAIILEVFFAPDVSVFRDAFAGNKNVSNSQADKDDSQ